MRNACDSDSRCSLACDASARDAKALAIAGRAMRTTKPVTLPVLPFLAFLVYQGKTSNLPRIFLTAEPTKPWKPRDNAKTTKEIPCLKLTKEIPKTRERKDRANIEGERQIASTTSYGVVFHSADVTSAKVAFDTVQCSQQIPRRLIVSSRMVESLRAPVDATPNASRSSHGV